MKTMDSTYGDDSTISITVAGPVVDPAHVWLPDAVLDAATTASALGMGIVSAGLVLRFGQPTEEYMRRHQVMGDPEAEIVDAWWRALSREQQDWLVRGTASLAAILMDKVRILATDPRPTAREWKVECINVLQWRDALASACAVLRRVRPVRGGVPSAAVEALDELLVKTFSYLVEDLGPLGPLLDDVVSTRPAYWWARPGRHREGR